VLEDEQYGQLKSMLDLASTCLQKAKQTIEHGPNHWAKEQIDKMLTSLGDDIIVAASLVDESYIIVSSDHLLSEESSIDG
jgi:hypothetical protein|tara:strand:+ start:704 stop:943 length:240 start_codon:yes stop_codon:yes gene_type:complete